MIKLFEQYNEYSEIKRWLNNMKIEDYIINEDLTVDVNGDVLIHEKELSKIPVRFRNVRDNFYCMDNILTTLEGCPKKVGGDFICYGNKLTTLEHCPEYIGRAFSCHRNNITTLKFFPNFIKLVFNIDKNPLPIEILEFTEIKIVSYTDPKILIKYQNEYGIWDTDGSFNKGRWKIFIKDYNDGILT